MADLKSSISLRDNFTNVLKKIDSGIRETVENMSNMNKQVEKSASSYQRMSNAAQASVNKMNSKISSGMSQISDKMASSNNKFISLMGNFGNRIGPSISNSLGKMGDMTGKAFDGMAKGADNAVKSISNSFKSLGSFMGNAGNSFKQFNNEIKSGFAEMRTGAQKSASVFKSTLGAIGVTKAIGVTTNAIKNSMDGAISRFDTFNKYPVVMEALGYSTQQVDSSMNKLSDGIDGLPTRLDDIVSSTQQFAIATGSLEKGTDTAIALNNAFLASGASAGDAARGAEQYRQMLGRGEVDMQSWRSVVDTMPVAMDKVAKSFSDQGVNSVNELYDALRDGNITFDQFNNRLIEMNDGVNGFADLARKNSAGIATSMANIRSSIVKGVEKSIRTVDDMLTKISGKGIAGHLDNFKNSINKSFESFNKGLENFMTKSIPYIEVMKNSFRRMGEAMSPAIDAVKQSLGKLTGSFGSVKSVAKFQSFSDSIIAIVGNLASFIEKHSDGIAKLITMLPKLALAFMGFKIGKGILSPLLNFAKGLGIVGGATKNLFKNLFGKKSPLDPKNSPLGKKPGANPVQSLLPDFSGLIKSAGNLALVFGAIKIAQEVIKAIGMFNDQVPSDFSSLIPKLASAGLVIGALGGFIALTGNLVKRNPITSAGGILAVGAMSGVLMLVAESLKQFNDKVPDDIGNVAKKTASMGIAIGGITALAGVIGGIASTGIGAIVMGGGLLFVSAFALELMLVAESLKQFDEKVPSNLANVNNKLNVMESVFARMTSINFGGFLGIFSNMFANINIMVITSSIRKLAKLGEALQELNDIDIPQDVDSKLFELQDLASKLDRSTLGDLFSNMITEKDLGHVVKSFESLVDISKQLEKIGNANFDFGSVDDTLSQIDLLISSLDNGDSLFNKLNTMFKSKVDTKVFSTAKESFKAISDISNELSNISISGQTFDYDAVIYQMKGIQNAIDLITGDESPFSAKQQSKASKFKASTIENVKEAMQSMSEMTDVLNSFTTVSLNYNAIDDSIATISQVIDNVLGDSSVSVSKKQSKSSKFDAETMSNVKETLTNMTEIASVLTSFSSVSFNFTSVDDQLEVLQEVIDKINNFGSKKGVKQSSQGNEMLASVLDSVKQITTIATSLDELQAVSFSFDAIDDQLVVIEEVVERIIGFNSLVDGNLETGNIDMIVSSVMSLNRVKSSLQEFGDGSLEIGNVTSALDAIRTAIDGINNLPEVVSTTSLESAITAIESLLQQMQLLISLADNTSASMSNLDAVTGTTMTNISTSVSTTMTGIVVSATVSMALFANAIKTGMTNSVSAVETGKAQMVSAMQGLNAEMFSAGQFAMQGLANGIEAGASAAISAATSVANQVSAAVKSAMDIHSPSRVMAKLGVFVSEGLAVGIMKASSLVENASAFLADLATPEDDDININDERIANIKASTSQQVVVQTTQVSPIVTVNATGTGNTEQDADTLADKVADKIMAIVDSSVD